MMSVISNRYNQHLITMASLKFLFFFALAVACVFAVEPERVKKDVLVGGAYPYAYNGLYSGAAGAAYVPTAYSAGYAALPAAGYAALPAAGYAGYPYGAGIYRSFY